MIQRNISYLIKPLLMICLLFSLSAPYVNACNTVTIDTPAITSDKSNNHCHETSTLDDNTTNKSRIKCDFLSCDNCCSQCFQSSNNTLISIKRSPYDTALIQSEAISVHQVTSYISHQSSPPTPPPTI